MADTEPTSHGVDTLIARLRDDGVAAGHAKAQRLRSETETPAAKLLADARAEARSDAKNIRQPADRR
ncbi:MAG: hypothetical protein GDA40_11825 [Rhodobacteraceae bacterium]|nr:hypothetical protein [Paracoccaceae bacterium]